MAIIKYNVENVESGGGGEQPQPALYKGKIAAMTARTEKADGSAVRDLEIVVDVGSEYARLWTYVKTPDDPNYNEAAHGWKFRELTDALKLQPKGSLDTAKMIGKEVNVKVVADTNLDGEYRGRIRSMFAPGKIAEDGDDLGEGGGAEEPLTQEELAEWSNDDLKEELEARSITLSGRFSSQKAIAAILEDQGEPEAEAETEPDEDGSGNGAVGGLDPELLEDLRTDPAFYDDWAEDDLKSYADDLGISGNVSGRKTKAKFVEAIVALAGSAEALMDGAGEASGETVEDDYDEWTQDELNDEVATRLEAGAEIKFTGRKTKEKLITALREDDKVAEPF